MVLAIRLFTGEISDFDLKLIRTFRAVAECGGFSLAEIELGTTKSAISKQISDLEYRLGVTLCHRGRSGFALTDEGQFVYDKSTTMLAALEGFRADLNTLHKSPTGVLHVGCIDSIITSRRSPVVNILGEFTETYPDVELKMITASAAEIDQSIADRRIQIGISTNRGKIKGTRTRSLFSEVGHLYCGRSHPLFQVADRDLSQELLNRQRFIQHGYSQAEIRDEHGISLDPSAVGQFSESIAMLILTGKFIGFLPFHYARSWVDAGEMRAMLPDQIVKTTDIQLIHHTDASSSPLISAFLSAANKVLTAEN